MNRIVLIACASRKKVHPAPARDLYQSALFSKSLMYAEGGLKPDGILILSAKHYLLRPDEVVAPYDRTLNNMSAEEVRAWAETVLSQLDEAADLTDDKFIILAGAAYRKYLVPYLDNVEVPLEGLRIGEQLRFLNEAINGE